MIYYIYIKIYLIFNSINYIFVDPKNKTIKISLRGHEILKALQQKEELLTEKSQTEGCSWHPEYG